VGGGTGNGLELRLECDLGVSVGLRGSLLVCAADLL